MAESESRQSRMMRVADGRAGGSLELWKAFWSRVDIGTVNNCWPWTGHTQSSGYGVFNYKRLSKYAHRVAMFWKAGKSFSSSYHVIHLCDNRACCNPRHLTVGTHKDNMEDMVRKQRFSRKLNEGDVREIRSSRLTRNRLAKMYKVSYSTIANIQNKKTWNRVE